MTALIKEVTPAVLAFIVVCGGFVTMYLKPEAKTEIIGLMTLVLSFYFGSSRGSEEKNKALFQNVNLKEPQG